jgi:hypothetical protein
MKDRCNHPKRYPNYGGRGITYAPEWEDFQVFLQDMGKMPSADLTLERVDNNGNYCKANCIWATYSVQNQNRGVSSRNKVGITGVSFNSVKNLWKAQKGQRHLYYGPSREKAIAARLAADQST